MEKIEKVSFAVRVYKSKWFSKFARKERITNEKLCEVIRNAEQGIIDADYGGGLIKQRIARPNEGKSGGYRSIVLFRQGERAFFIYGFPKNEQGNISKSDEIDFKELAKSLLNASEEELKDLVRTGKYDEVRCNDKDQKL